MCQSLIPRILCNIHRFHGKSMEVPQQTETGSLKTETLKLTGLVHTSLIAISKHGLFNLIIKCLCLRAFFFMCIHLTVVKIIGYALNKLPASIVLMWRYFLVLYWPHACQMRQDWNYGTQERHPEASRSGKEMVNAIS